MSYIGKWVDIQCFKHDGKLHRTWDRGYVVLDNDDYIAIAAKRAKVIEYNGRKWFTKEPAITVFSKKHWFNVICMFKKNFGTTYYCNIASPSIIDKKTIKYIDYDIDLKLFQNGQIKYLDEKEYETNKKKYGYSNELDTVIKFETERVHQMMLNKEFPYDDKTVEGLFNEFLNNIIENKGR